MNIAGSNVIVTGAASGIGAGMARRFASMGAANVVVADLDGDGAAAVADEIGGLAHQVDVGSQASVQALVAGAIDAIGTIDLFCANAGVGVGGGLDVDVATWDLSWRVNVLGPVLAAREVIPHMLANGGGTFQITASAAGLVTGPTSFNYAVSKHAAIGVAEWLAVNHAPDIKVACLCPTIVDTPMIAHFDGLEQPLTVDDVVDSLLAGLADDRFLIVPNDNPVQMFRAKAADYDGFIATLAGRLGAMRRAAD